jgi:hypothetical protein
MISFPSLWRFLTSAHCFFKAVYELADANGVFFLCIHELLIRHSPSRPLPRLPQQTTKKGRSRLFQTDRRVRCVTQFYKNGVFAVLVLANLLTLLGLHKIACSRQNISVCNTFVLQE